jgi:hypothetical protein
MLQTSEPGWDMRWIDCGHVQLGRRNGQPPKHDNDRGRPEPLPGGRRAFVTPTTLLSFERGLLAARECADDALGVIVGDVDWKRHATPWHLGNDLAWLPASYRAALDGSGVSPARLVLVSEARLQELALDLAAAWSEGPSAEALRLGEEERDESNQRFRPLQLHAAGQQGELAVGLLKRTRKGDQPLCALLYAALLRCIHEAGLSQHLAIYAHDDDPHIERKLFNGALVSATLDEQLPSDFTHTHWTFHGSSAGYRRSWTRDDLLA